MSDFLNFVGPVKTLFYGMGVGFGLGVVFCIWADIRHHKRDVQ